MANRPRHPRKEIEAAVEYAIHCGWQHTKATGNAWGMLRCPWNDKECRCGTFCQFSIWSTPKNAENHARQIIRLIDGCIRKRGHRPEPRETTMEDFSFVLNFALPAGNENPAALADALFEAGCDDATVGVGQVGTIVLDFTRSAESAEAALRSAIQNVTDAIPGAKLVQAGPDLVGLTDMAEIFGFTRQNMRKYATGKASFPVPAHIGEPSLWHLAEIVAWLRGNTGIQPRDDMFAVAKAAAKINFETEQRRVRRILALA